MHGYEREKFGEERTFTCCDVFSAAMVFGLYGLRERYPFDGCVDHVDEEFCNYSIACTAHLSLKGELHCTIGMKIRFEASPMA